ncbi:beta-propeller fold lactonase family protein [Kitasatospora sp. NPDC048296]|uniref:beta-propeller fold lactonase family protein n=1 Tax=Kitasatospora sp. NPDC048296 TaxID=3364048 RepID=UPI003711B923
MSATAKNLRARAALAVVAVLGGALAVAGAPGVASASTGRAATVYTLSNSAAGNSVLAFRDVHGVLAPAGSYPTGGLGSDAGLGSQGAVVPADHGRILLAVNAGSDSVTSLRVAEDGVLSAVATVASGGTRPVSVTVHGDLVYVLNAGSGTITGFRLHDGVPAPLAGSTRAVSSGAAGAAEVAFSPDGSRLVVTEKGSNSLDTFTVDRHGRASTASRTASAAAVPFGFDFDSRGNAVVSDAAASAVTTYSVASGTARQLAYLPDGGGAACWLVVSRPTGTAYVANAATGTISTYRVHDGALTLTAPIAATVGGHPTDEALGRGDVLYIRDATNNRLQAVRFGAVGAQVTDAPSVLPGSAAGIAVVDR